MAIIKHSIHINNIFSIQFEISSKDNNEMQLERILFILLILFIFHFEISGKNDNNLKS